jgi:hypothetical protein
MLTSSRISLRELGARLASHLLGILAYSALTPVIVSYTMLTLATLGLLLVAGGGNEQGTPLRELILRALAIGDGAWVAWLWSEDRSFAQNALRLFGGLGFLLWLIEQVTLPFRRWRQEPRVSLGSFLPLVRRLAVFTGILATLILTAGVVIGPGGEPLTPLWVLRAAATAYGMGLILLLSSLPALGVWFALGRARDWIVARAARVAATPYAPTARPTA